MSRYRMLCPCEGGEHLCCSLFKATVGNIQYPMRRGIPEIARGAAYNLQVYIYCDGKVCKFIFHQSWQGAQVQDCREDDDVLERSTSTVNPSALVTCNKWRELHFVFSQRARGQERGAESVADRPARGGKNAKNPAVNRNAKIPVVSTYCYLYP